ncbi:MAG: hypothetical protein ACXW6K_16160 [Candidatus Binatia bacterium]
MSNRTLAQKALLGGTYSGVSNCPQTAKYLGGIDANLGGAIGHMVMANTN